MGRDMPWECEHGKVMDWGDFGGPNSTPQYCPECDRGARPTQRVLRMAHVRENTPWPDGAPTNPADLLLAQSMDGPTAVYVWWLEDTGGRGRNDE